MSRKRFASGVLVPEHSLSLEIGKLEPRQTGKRESEVKTSEIKTNKDTSAKIAETSTEAPTFSRPEEKLTNLLEKAGFRDEYEPKGLDYFFNIATELRRKDLTRTAILNMLPDREASQAIVRFACEEGLMQSYIFEKEQCYKLTALGK